MDETKRFFDNSDEICRYVSDITDGVCILSFSRGKDSIVSWLKLKRFFKIIVPVYLYSIRGLSFVEDSIKYYEDFFKTRILQMPHPSYYRWFNKFVFQAPDNLWKIESLGLPDFTYDDVFDIIREKCGIKAAFGATGVRSSDSVMRRMIINKYGPLNWKRKTFFPVFDYKKEDLVHELNGSGIHLPVDYLWFGRTFDGIDYRFISVIKEKSPGDYEKIINMFPLVELETKKIEWRKKWQSMT